MATKKPITFLLSVDTEEEWEWDGPFPEKDFAVENISKLDSFQTFCEQNAYRPVYFVDYAAAKAFPNYPQFFNSERQQNYEIGAHLHPWANPPYFGPANDEKSHIVNLPLDHVEQKLDALLTLFADTLKCKPQSFRSGRWGISEEILQLLLAKGFNIDSSVYPFYKNQYFDCLGCPLKPYWPSFNDVLSCGQQDEILEMPVTVGFNHTPFAKYAKLHDFCQKSSMKILKATAVLWHTSLMRKIYFSPEVASAKDMIDLAEASIKQGNQCLHMFMHSSSFLDNSTGFLKANGAFELICERIKGVTAHLEEKYDVTYMTASEYKLFLQKNPQYIAE